MGTKQRNMNHFLSIGSLLLAHEHIRPTANVALVLSKATLETHREIQFCLSKNGYFLTKNVITFGLLGLAWNVGDKKAGRFLEPSRAPSASKRKVLAPTFRRQSTMIHPRRSEQLHAHERSCRTQPTRRKPSFNSIAPEFMTCLACSQGDVLFFCRACGHGTCLDC